MRAFEFLKEADSFWWRDKQFFRFWWFDNNFEWLDDTEVHADFVISRLEDMATGDPEDALYHVGNDAEDVNQYFIETYGAVRGGIIKDFFDNAYLDSNNLKNIHKCLRQLVKKHPQLNQVTIDCNGIHETFFGETFEFFLKYGKMNSKLKVRDKHYS